MNIIPELNLNCHPKDVKNNSLAHATNVMVCNNSTILESECELTEIADTLIPSEIKNKNIIYALPCNKEILFFNLEENNTISIIRYDEERNQTKKVLEGLTYHNGKLLGTFTYNKNNLIIAISEYDSTIDVPLKTFNLGAFNDEIIINEFCHSIVPKIKIPNIDYTYNLGNAYKGWYYVFIRYKIDKYNYTQWYNTNNYFLIDSYTKNKILNYYETPDIKKELYGINTSVITNETINYVVSSNIDISDITATIKVNDLDENYEFYQIGFICITKTYTKAFKSNDIKTNNNEIIINNKLEDYSVTELIKSNYNYYNTKSLDNINNRLYIGNYKTKSTKINDSFKLIGRIITEKINTNDKTIGALNPYYLFEYNQNGININYNYYNNQLEIINGKYCIIGKKLLLNNGKTIEDTFDRTNFPLCHSGSDFELGKCAILYIDDLYFDIVQMTYFYKDKDPDDAINRLNTKSNDTIYITPSTTYKIINNYGTYKNNTNDIIKDYSLNVLNSASIAPNEYYNLFITFVDEYGEFSDALKITNDNIEIFDEYDNKVSLINNLWKSKKTSYTIDKDGKYIYNSQKLTIKLTSNFPIGYVGYFISYEKFEPTIKNKGILFRDYDNTDDKYLYFYSDSLNYRDEINLNFNKIRIYKTKSKNTEFNNIEIINDRNKVTDTEDTKEFDIIEKELLVADSIGNELNSTRIRILVDYKETDLITKGGYINDYSYCELINDDITDLYNNTNKELIPCSNISYNKNEIIVNFKNAFFSNISALIFRNKYFDYSVNVFKSYGNSNYNLFYCRNFIEIPNESIYIYNKPSVIAFPNKLNESVYKLTFIYGSIIEAKNTIDLFKERLVPSYKHYPKSNYFFENNTINIFNKTFRRSNIIQDESDVNAWRTFNVEDYRNMHESKGEITKLIGIGKYIIVHTEHSIFLFNATDTIKSNEGGIQLASVDILNLNYQEIITSRLGYAGLQKEHHGIIGTFGYIFYSVEDKAIYRYDADKLITIDDTISNYIRKHNFSDAIFVDDKYRNRLLIKFTNDEMSIILSYNYKTNSFVSLHDYDFTAGYSTKNNIYVLSSNDTIKQFNENYFNKSSISVVVNTDYELMKYLDVIKYKINKPKSISSLHNVLVPPGDLNNTAEGIITNLRIYSEYCDTENVPVINNTLIPNLNIKDDYNTPYWRFGNWHFSAIRNKLMNETIPSDQKSRIFGNWFVVRFDVEKTSCAIYESLDYKISFDEN